MAREKFDVIVIGSGASGSFAVHELTSRGANVLLLEAGRAIGPGDFTIDDRPPSKDGMQLWDRARAALAGQPIQSRVAFYGRQQQHLFVNDREHPYSTPRGKPFLWIRGKQLGGRLHTYGRVLMRWSDLDFKAASRDGYGQDWPISYADLAPWYDSVEDMLQLRGDVDNVPNLPDGKFAGSAKLTEAERAFKSATEERWNERKVVAWRYMPPNIKRVPQPILAALETGLLTIRSDAVVRQIVTDVRTGKATGVEYVDRATKSVETVDASAIMVCASPIESVRLLLNSAGGKHPHGLGNSSGMLGRYFMDQVPNLTMGNVPSRTGWEADETVPADPFYGVTGGVYVPRYTNLLTGNGKFLRGFAFQGTVGRWFAPETRPGRFGFMGFGEMLPHPDNRITLHPSRKDRWGIPIPHIDIQMRENEIGMLKEQTRAIVEMAGNAGLDTEFSGSSLGLEEHGEGAFPDAGWFSRLVFRMNFRGSMALGAAIHESGGARMGIDPATSIVGDHNQCWDAPNVFVTDASAFPTSGCSGTTLTVMAMSSRAGAFVATQLAAGTL